jgi:hypothetical protein
MSKPKYPVRWGKYHWQYAEDAPIITIQTDLEAKKPLKTKREYERAARIRKLVVATASFNKLKAQFEHAKISQQISFEVSKGLVKKLFKERHEMQRRQRLQRLAMLVVVGLSIMAITLSLLLPDW